MFEYFCNLNFSYSASLDERTRHQTFYQFTKEHTYLFYNDYNVPENITLSTINISSEIMNEIDHKQRDINRLDFFN